MARIYDADAVEAMREVTMHVHLKRRAEFRVRVWLGVRLMALAAWVMNCNIQLTDGDE
jgi:hypothetical protein